PQRSTSLPTLREFEHRTPKPGLGHLHRTSARELERRLFIEAEADLPRDRLDGVTCTSSSTTSAGQIPDTETMTVTVPSPMKLLDRMYNSAISTVDLALPASRRRLIRLLEPDLRVFRSRPGRGRWRSRTRPGWCSRGWSGAGDG